MAARRLAPQRVAELRAEPFTYEHVGATASGPPPGYDWFERSTLLKRRDFQGAAEELFSWGLHERAGLRVEASASPLLEDSVVLMRLGLGAASLRIPCRVVYTVWESRRRGFAYGTLPGHPESGEERFLLEHRGDGSIKLTITAFSRPASRLAIVGGPVSRGAQALMTGRYLRALDRA